MKTMDSFSNGVYAYAFHMKKKPSPELYQRIYTDAIDLMTSSVFLVDFFLNQQLNVKEYKYCQLVYNYAIYFMQQESEDVDNLVKSLEQDGHNMKKLNNIILFQNINLK